MNEDQLLTELDFKAVRSSGPGGQHANKTATRVELSFHLQSSLALSDEEKERIFKKLENNINKDGYLKMGCEDSRSQAANKEQVIKNFFKKLKSALKTKKKRKKTKPTRASKIKRLKEKRRNSEIKANRKSPI